MTHPEDEQPSEEELAEAAALARALDRGSVAGREAPEDALSTAALLRYARRGATLDPSRSEAILEDVLRGAGRVRNRRRRIGVLAALGLSVAAAGAFLLARSGPHGEAPLPPPPAELLSAQIEAARPGSEDLAVLEREMRPYRGRLHAALEERYSR